MCYDSYVQLPEGIHLENLEHKHSIASKLQHIGLAHGPMGQSSLTQQRETGLWKELVIMCCNVLQLRSSFVAWACNLHQSFDLESTQNYSRLSRRCRKIAHDCRRNPPFCMPWNDVAPHFQYQKYVGFPWFTLVRASCRSFRIYSVLCLCSNVKSAHVEAVKGLHEGFPLS